MTPAPTGMESRVVLGLLALDGVLSAVAGALLLPLYLGRIPLPVSALICGLLNVAGYYDGLTAFLDHAASEQFVRADQRRMLIVESDSAALLDRYASYVAPASPKWVGRDET